MSAHHSVTARVMGYQLRDLARSRWLGGYGLFFLVAAELLLRFGGGGAKALVSLVNVVLLLVPMVSTVFGTMYVYNAREFIELLLAQPVRRDQLYLGLYLGLALPLSAAFGLGLAIPFLVRGAAAAPAWALLATTVGTGMVLTAVFVALAFVIAIGADDKVKGLGVAVGVWLAFGLLYDGAVLLAVLVFGDYPLERALLGLTFANPIDLARVLLLLQMDTSALMGYTGAVFERFFGGVGGRLAATAALACWVTAPVLLGMRQFRKHDF